MTWVAGRQGTGYDKRRVFESAWLKCDCYLLRYRPGSYIGPHKDIVPGHRHYRINVIWSVGVVGGEFYAESSIVDWPWLKVFRSDWYHNVALIESGTRYVLSFGFLRKKR